MLPSQDAGRQDVPARACLPVGDPDNVGGVGAPGVEGVAGGDILEGHLDAGLLEDGSDAHLLGLLQPIGVCHPIIGAEDKLFKLCCFSPF